MVKSTSKLCSIFTTLSTLLLVVHTTSAFLQQSSQSISTSLTQRNIRIMKPMSSSSKHQAATSSTDQLTWDDLQNESANQSVGKALNEEVEKRKQGKGSAHVQSKLRLFGSQDDNTKPKLTLYRDHAGWCPYCQKTMLLVEEKEVPINIELVPMRSYGDKPAEFMRMVPGGLLPALTVEMEDGRKQTITESQVIMELLDKWHPPSEGYKPMLPEENDNAGWAKYDNLARLERELFSWWCTLIFRPEGPRSMPGGLMNLLGKNKKDTEMSGAMKGFLDCLSKVENALSSTSGPWFFEYDYPTMIDFVYASHVERMLASCAYWKGLNLRSEEMKSKYPSLNLWLDSFDKREHFLAFKSDYYTHVKDIPPQYGPGYNGGFQEQEAFANMITGEDGKSWKLPLSHDDPLQPLYKGPPLPLCVLKSVGIQPDEDGTYENSDPYLMAKTCREMAAWKLAGNGPNVSKFAARGGKMGANNPRKPFGAELADPYANADEVARPHVDAALRVVCKGLLGDSASTNDEMHLEFLKSLEPTLQSVVPAANKEDVINSLSYLRDRVGVPRDLPLASARQLRAHLNWAMDTIE